MTTSDPDTTAQDPDVLREIVLRFGGQLCLNAAVVPPVSSKSVTAPI
jgi:hypothetical protein